MPYSPDSSISERIRIELIEADIEQAFGLVDLAQTEAAGGDTPSSCRVLNDAERVFLDMELRLTQLGPEGAKPFILLVVELRRSIEQARLRCT
jgi:hypothetical protein